MTRHEWRDRNDEGELVYYRADHHAGNWTFSSRAKSAEDWTFHDALGMEEMERLREVLWNKHLRRRLPLKHVEEVDGILADLKRKQPPSSDEEE